jgi:KDO2-lipid IV(A) lauroyltransferase
MARKSKFRKKIDARLRHARFLAEYAALRTVEFGLRSLGVDRASRVSGALWRTFAPFNQRHQSALTHLAVAFPDMSLAERKRIAGDVWENLGRSFAEGMMLDKILADPSRFRMPDPAEFEKVRQTGGRVVFVSMHSANWELSTGIFQQAGFDITTTYQRINNPLVDAWVVAMRLPYLPGGLHVKGGDTVRRFLEWGRAGNTVALLSDLRNKAGTKVPFFGYDAPSTPLPAFLARTLEVPIVGVRMVRERGVFFRIETEFLPYPETEDRDRDIAAATAIIQAKFEDWIRDEPGQWMWAHRRWTHAGPPEGFKSPNK